jgi:hypothetical protein
MHYSEIKQWNAGMKRKVARFKGQEGEKSIGIVPFEQVSLQIIFTT